MPRTRLENEPWPGLVSKQSNRQDQDTVHSKQTQPHALGYKVNISALVLARDWWSPISQRPGVGDVCLISIV